MSDEFCRNIQDSVVRGYCNELVRIYSLQPQDFDTGTVSLDLKKSEDCNVSGTTNTCTIPPSPDGKVSEPEVMQQVISFAEREYIALVNSLRSDGSGIPTPFLDYFYKSGGTIPWLFRDPGKLATAVKKTQDLRDLFQQELSSLQMAKSLYSFVVNPLNKDGYQISFCNAPYRPELNMDSLVDAGSARCNEYDILMLGFGLLTNGPEMDVVATVKGYSPEHMFMGLRVLSGKSSKYYRFDPSAATIAQQTNTNDTGRTIRLSKLQLMGIYYSERMSSCPAYLGAADSCIKDNIAWAERYAPDFFAPLYAAAVGYFNLGLRDLSKKYLQLALEAFPGLTPDSQLLF